MISYSWDKPGSFEEQAIEVCFKNPAAIRYFRQIEKYYKLGKNPSDFIDRRAYDFAKNCISANQYDLISINWVFPYNNIKSGDVQYERIKLEPFNDGTIEKTGDIEEDNIKVGTVKAKYDADGNVEYESVANLSGNEIYKAERVDGNLRVCVVHPKLPNIVVVNSNGVTKFVKTVRPNGDIDTRIKGGEEVSEEYVKNRIPKSQNQER